MIEDSAKVGAGIKEVSQGIAAAVGRYRVVSSDNGGAARSERGGEGAGTGKVGWKGLVEWGGKGKGWGLRIGEDGRAQGSTDEDVKGTQNDS